jgi:hypothetical protein
MFDSIEYTFGPHSFSNFLRRKLRQLRGANKWPTIEAKVLSCDWVVSPGAEGDVGNYEIQFAFDLDGTSYDGGFSLPGYGTERLFIDGDTIQIQYNPRDPNESLYSDAWSKGESVLLSVLFVCFVCLFFLIRWVVTGSPGFSSSGHN